MGPLLPDVDGWMGNDSKVREDGFNQEGTFARVTTVVDNY
jgi:hypothetical protein